MKEITCQCFNNADCGITRGAFCTFCQAVEGHGIYGKVSRELLLSLQTFAAGTVPTGIQMKLYRPTKTSTHRKRGRRGGLRRRLKSLWLDNRRKLPPLPSVLLSNVQSELETYAKFKGEAKDTSPKHGS